jgi:hypothetical protein
VSTLLIVFSIALALVIGVLAWWGRATLKEHPIRAFALLVVTLLSSYMVYANERLITIISSPDWCGKAMQAERILPGNQFQGLTGCIDIMKIQLEAVSRVLVTNSYTIALSVLVLIVIVVAGARLAGKFMGNELDMSRQDAQVAGAEKVVAAATEEKNKIVEETNDGQRSSVPE